MASKRNQLPKFAAASLARSGRLVIFKANCGFSATHDSQQRLASGADQCDRIAQNIEGTLSFEFDEALSIKLAKAKMSEHKKHKKMSEHKRSRQEVCDALSEISSVNSDRPRRHWQSGSCRGLRDLIASFGQNMITVPSETTHV